MPKAEELEWRRPGDRALGQSLGTAGSSNANRECYGKRLVGLGRGEIQRL